MANSNGSYSEVSGRRSQVDVLGSLGRPNVGILFVETAKTCCYETAVRWNVNMSGQRLSCSRCNNLLKSVESFDSPVQPDTDPMGLPTWKLEEGFAYFALMYQKSMFHENKVHLDLEAQSLRDDGIVDSSDLFIAVQNPAKWFDSGHEMVLAKLDNGCDALIGKIQGRFVGKRAPTGWLRRQFDADDTSFEYAG
jgi:hypothetical protein